MATVTGSGIKAAREEKGLSQRKLARQLAERLGDPERATALGVQLSRIERREHSDLDENVAQALAEELAVGVRDLEEGVLYTWARRLEGGGYTFPALGLRHLLWTSPEAASDGRDLIVAEDQRFPHFDLNIARGATLVPSFRQAVRWTLEANFVDLAEHELERLMVVDPSSKAVQELTIAQIALAAEDSESRRGAAEAWARAAAEGNLETVGPDELFNLAERRATGRMRSGDPALDEVPRELIARWKREHDALAHAALAYLARRYDHLKGRLEGE